MCQQSYRIALWQLQTITPLFLLTPLPDWSVCIILYTIKAINISHNHRVDLIAVSMVVTGLLFLKASFKQVYKRRFQVFVIHYAFLTLFCFALLNCTHLMTKANLKCSQNIFLCFRIHYTYLVPNCSWLSHVH